MACITGITLAMMGVVYLLLRWATRSTSRAAALQPMCMARVTTHIIGPGGPAATAYNARWQALSRSFGPPKKFWGMGLMGLGGFDRHCGRADVRGHCAARVAPLPAGTVHAADFGCGTVVNNPTLGGPDGRARPLVLAASILLRMNNRFEPDGVLVSLLPPVLEQRTVGASAGSVYVQGAGIVVRCCGHQDTAAAPWFRNTDYGDWVMTPVFGSSGARTPGYRHGGSPCATFGVGPSW